MRSSFGRSWILYSPPLINPNTLDLNSQPYDHVDDVSPPIGELQMATLVILASLGPCHVERFQVRSFEGTDGILIETREEEGVLAGLI